MIFLPHDWCASNRMQLIILMVFATTASPQTLSPNIGIMKTGLGHLAKK